MRQTTQSLALVATEIAAKAKRTQIHQSVAHRFVGKLRDLELIADAGATGFVLHASGKEQIEQAFPEIFPPKGTNDTPSNGTEPATAQKKSETGATGVGKKNQCVTLAEQTDVDNQALRKLLAEPGSTQETFGNPTNDLGE